MTNLVNFHWVNFVKSNWDDDISKKTVYNNGTFAPCDIHLNHIQRTPAAQSAWVHYLL